MILATPILFVPPPPPGIVVAAQQEARDLFSSLECWLSSTPALTLPLHLVEQQQQIKGRQVQRVLLQAHVQQRGTGDVGPALKLLQASSCSLFTHRRLQRRTLNTIFGPIHIDRIGYSHPGQPSIHPLDEALQLPARSFSYELQKRLVQAAVQGPLRESIDRILDISGLSVPMRSREQILQDAAQDFDAFYAQRPADPSSPAASILVVAVDCKGIPIVKPPRNERSVRRTKGQKANRKKMATVAAVFTRQAWIRTPEQVVENLYRVHTKTNHDQSPPPKPENKRVWASLVKGKAARVNLNRVIHFLKNFFGENAIVADLHDLEQAAIRLETNSSPYRQVAQVLADIKVAGVVDGGFRAQGAAFFVILLDARSLVVDME